MEEQSRQGIVSVRSGSDEAPTPFGSDAYATPKTGFANVGNSIREGSAATAVENELGRPYSADGTIDPMNAKLLHLSNLNKDKVSVLLHINRELIRMCCVLLATENNNEESLNNATVSARRDYMSRLQQNLAFLANFADKMQKPDTLSRPLPPITLLDVPPSAAPNSILRQLYPKLASIIDLQSRSAPFTTYSPPNLHARPVSTIAQNSSPVKQNLNIGGNTPMNTGNTSLSPQQIQRLQAIQQQQARNLQMRQQQIQQQQQNSLNAYAQSASSPPSDQMSYHSQLLSLSNSQNPLQAAPFQ